MSVTAKSDHGFLISHSNSINEIYKDLRLEINPNLFKIQSSYKKVDKTRNNKLGNEESKDYKELEEEVEKVKKMFDDVLNRYKEKLGSKKQFFSCQNNEEALKTAADIYEQSGKAPVEAFGFNEFPIIKEISSTEFVFPENCKFFCKDVKDLDKYLVDEKYDLILLDPPWWNRYIRRKRKKSPHAYNMMFNNDLKNLPLENLLKDTGMVVVWCTNAIQHFKQLKDEIFPKWGVEFVGKWYWVKVTVNLEPICGFSKPPRKQPFEQIIFGCKGGKTEKVPPIDRVVVSVPSALHSHKPPLNKLLEEYLPENPACLEIFARYLLPGWTSYGNEALRFQNKCIFTKLQ